MMSDECRKVNLRVVVDDAKWMMLMKEEEENGGRDLLL
jgi:hypothetical protein